MVSATEFVARRSSCGPCCFAWGWTEVVKNCLQDELDVAYAVSESFQAPAPPQDFACNQLTFFDMCWHWLEAVAEA